MSREPIAGSTFWGTAKAKFNAMFTEIYTAVDLNTAKTGITTSQSSAIVTNTAKTGITTSQASAITTNTAKTGITVSQIAAIAANTLKITSKWFVDGVNEIYCNKFVKLGGTGAPAIKQVLITGTTGGTNTSSSYTTNITKANVVAFNMQISDSYGNWIPPSFGTAGTDSQWYKAYIGSNGMLYIEILSESTDLNACAFSCLITYTE